MAFPYEAIKTVVSDASGVHPTSVIWDGDAVPIVGPKPGTRSRTLITLSATPRKVSAFLDPKDLVIPETGPTEQVTIGFRSFQLEVRAECYNEDASDALEDLRMGVTDEHRAALRDEGVTIYRFGDIVNLGGTADNRATDISVLEIFCGLIVEKRKSFPDGGDYIETATPPVYVPPEG